MPAARELLSSLLRHTRWVLRTPSREIFTTFHAAVVLVAVELLIRWVPLPRLTRMLGLRISLEPVRPDAERLHPADLSPLAVRQLRCAHRVADAWPFSNGPCLRRSLVAGHLLRRCRPALRLGVAGAGDKLIAHAWVEIDDRPLDSVVGLNVFQRGPAEATR